jgi:uncharacterized Fe-S cluster protein YjdI
MGRTYRKDKSFRPKGRGQTFNKDQKPWKKPSRPSNQPPPQTFDPC